MKTSINLISIKKLSIKIKTQNYYLYATIQLLIKRELNHVFFYFILYLFLCVHLLPDKSKIILLIFFKKKIVELFVWIKLVD